MTITIVAEAGVNHNGSAQLAHELVDAAHSAGADIVKFQTFKASAMVLESAPLAEYQARNKGEAETQLAMLQRLELGYEVHRELVKYCDSLGIRFLSTAFDSGSLDFLVRDLGLETLKIPSGELTNAPFVLEHARTGCDLIVSTGMATLAEVESALGVIAFGLVADADAIPDAVAINGAYTSDVGQEALKRRVMLLHCTTEYPAPMSEINLRAMQTMTNAFGLNPGYSDHSMGITIPVAAAAMGAQLIEKHFTLDRTMEGPDHGASLEPGELAAMVREIRNVELALGSGVKGPQHSEVKNMPVARKSLVAASPIGVGELFTEANLTVMRPGDGLSPGHYWSLLGSAASRNYETGEQIRE